MDCKEFSYFRTASTDECDTKKQTPYHVITRDGESAFVLFLCTTSQHNQSDFYRTTAITARAMDNWIKAERQNAASDEHDSNQDQRSTATELAKKIELFAFRFGTQNYVGFNGNRVAHVSLLHFILNLC